MNVPDHLTTAVRAAADTAPPHAGDLAAVRRRGHARRRHRAVTGTGLVALAVAAAVSTPFAVTGADQAPMAAPPASSEPAEPSVPAPPAEPAQRLVTSGFSELVSTGETEPPEEIRTGREAYQWYRDHPEAEASGVLDPVTEVWPDGTAAPLDVDLPGIDSIQELVPMPDGRLAAIGLVDLMPGVERTDGPCVEGIATPLLVVERDGSVSVSRDLRVRCQTLRLVAASRDTAYLLRDDRLVAHDLATGDERVLLESAPPAGPGLDYAAGRLAVVTEGDEPSCGPGTVGRLVVRVAEVATGATAEYPLADQSCGISGGPLRLSPDGRYAAYEYLWHEEGGSYRSQVKVAVLDLARGERVVDHLVAEPTGRNSAGLTGRRGISVEAGDVTAGVVGLAWDDPQTLRLAWYEVPRDGVYWLPEVVQQTTVPVAG